MLSSSVSSNMTNLAEFFSYSRAEFLQYAEYSSVSFLNRCLTGYVSLFMPFIVALASLPLFCDEKSSGFYKWECLRTNKKTYFWGKAVSGALLSLSAVVTGILILGIAVFLRFPLITEYSEDSLQYVLFGWLSRMPLISGGDVQSVWIPFLLLRLLFICISALVFYCLTYLLAVCISNKYILLCLPTVIFLILPKTIIIHSPVFEWISFPSLSAEPFFMELFSTNFWLYFVLVILYAAAFLFPAHAVFMRKCKVM